MTPWRVGASRRKATGSDPQNLFSSVKYAGAIAWSRSAEPHQPESTPFPCLPCALYPSQPNPDPLAIHCSSFSPHRVRGAITESQLLNTEDTENRRGPQRKMVQTSGQTNKYGRGAATLAAPSSLRAASESSVLNPAWNSSQQAHSSAALKILSRSRCPALNVERLPRLRSFRAAAGAPRCPPPRYALPQFQSPADAPPHGRAR